jgi:hypothetical protein
MRLWTQAESLFVYRCTQLNASVIARRSQKVDWTAGAIGFMVIYTKRRRIYDNGI